MGEILVPQCPKYVQHSCWSCFVYILPSQCIPSGSCSIWNLSTGLLNIPTHPCHVFIQHGIKIVCLNCYLGSVNTSGQQELKLNSVLTQAAFSMLRPHQHLITRTSPWIWAKCFVVWLLRHQFTAAAFILMTLTHMWSGNFQRKKKKGRERSSLKAVQVYHTQSWIASTRFHSCLDCPLPLLS